MPEKLDGKHVAAAIKSEIASKVKDYRESGKRAPHLAISIVGDAGASPTYVGGKTNACKVVGCDYNQMQPTGTIPAAKLISTIESKNPHEHM